MPRTRTGTAWLIRIPDDLAAQIDQRAQRVGLSRAEVVRRMLRWANKQPPAETRGTS